MADVHIFNPVKINKSPVRHELNIIHSVKQAILFPKMH